jgi:hypothetical protein
MSEEVTKLVNEKQFVALFKECENKRTRAQSINGEIGERIKTAVEDGNLHRKLFSLMRALARMDELKRKDFLSQFDVYVEMCERAGFFGSEHVSDLVDDAQRDAAGEKAEADERAAKSNVRKLREGIKPLDGDSDDAPGTFRVN